MDRLVLSCDPISHKSGERTPMTGAVPPLGETGPMAHVLSAQERCTVIHDLCEGASINSIVRKHGIAKTTILRLLVAVGHGCAQIHNRLFRGLSCHLLQCDEIWSYIQKKEARVTPMDPPDHGEAYTFVALDVASRAVVGFLVGRRGDEATQAFIKDLRARLTVVPQISTDGWTAYIQAIADSFGGFVDYAQTIKNYSSGGRRDDHRYEPPRDPFIVKRAVFGVPDMDKASTSLVERQNRTMRMHIRRMTRLCDAFSKKRANHDAATALHFAYYNLVRIHDTIETTPAVSLGVVDRPWTLAELVEVALAEPQVEGPIAKPLELRPNAGPARALPGCRGFLRLVGSPPHAAPAQSAASVPPAVKLAVVPPSAQGDLFEWAANRPAKPRQMEQLSLFDDE